MKEELIDQMVRRLAVMADKTRVRVLMRLKRGECNVTQLAAELKIGQASMSKHLATLRDAGLVEVEHRGRQSVYRVGDRSFYNICDHLTGDVIRHAKRQHAALGLGPARARRPARKTPRKGK